MRRLLARAFAPHGPVEKAYVAGLGFGAGAGALIFAGPVCLAALAWERFTRGNR